MTLQVTKSGNRVGIAEDGGDAKYYAQDEISEYGFNGDNTLEITIKKNGKEKFYSCAFADLTIEGAVPVSKAAAITALATVFLNVGSGTPTLQAVADEGNETIKPLLYKGKISPLVFLGYDLDNFAGYTCTQEFIDFINSFTETPFYVNGVEVDYGYLQYTNGLVAYFTFDDGTQDEDFDGAFVKANYDSEDTLVSVGYVNNTLLTPINNTLSNTNNNVSTLQQQLLLIPARPGLTWVSRVSAVDNDWLSVCFGNGVFVAVSNNGTGNRVMTSNDGINWISRVSAADNQWKSVCFGNGLFVAVSTNGTGDRVMTSPDGITWTSRSSAANNSWMCVCFGRGLFTAVSFDGSGNRVMTSPDGITWTSRTSAANNQWYSVCFGNGLFVAVSADGTDRVMTSPDGITWTSRTSASQIQWAAVCYANGLFVAVARVGLTPKVMTSIDGITWAIQNGALSGSWESICYGYGLFIVTDTQNGLIMTSPDGINWTSRTKPANDAWNCVCYGNGIFVGVSADGIGNRVMTSGFNFS